MWPRFTASPSQWPLCELNKHFMLNTRIYENYFCRSFSFLWWQLEENSLEQWFTVLFFKFSFWLGWIQDPRSFIVDHMETDNYLWSGLERHEMKTRDVVKMKSTRVQSDVKKRNKRVLVSSAFLVRRTLKLWGCDANCTAVKVLKAGAGDLSCMSDDSGLFCCFFQSDSCRVQCLKQRLVQWVTVCSCQPP